MKKAQTPFTQAQVKALFNYNPLTGVMTWRKNGKVAGGVNGHGYWLISHHREGKQYKHKAHRLAWLYVHGTYPDGEIDHRDRDRTNNRISNLRIATRRENTCNRKVLPVSGLTGVYFNPHAKVRKWVAGIWMGHKNKHLGNYRTKLAAAYARHQAELQL